jgi:L-iditol 2-dehydrogenase
MKALLLEAYNQLEYEEVPDPKLAKDEVLIQVKACGICGSDVHGMDGSTGRRIPPIIMGHEASGVISEIDQQVSGFAPGDRVTFDSTIYCGNCSFCRRGKINLCENRRVLGVSCEEYRQHGAFAEYVSVPQRILYPIPEGVSFQQAAMVEACSVAFHAVRRAQVDLGASAVVVGTGMIGLLVIQALRVAGCSQIIAVDIDDRKLEMACQLGADACFNSNKEEVARLVRDRTNGQGAELAYEVVGMTSSCELALGSLRKGGSLILVGNISPQVTLPLQSIVTREITLLGSCASQGEYPACLEMILRGRINVDALISEIAPLAEGASWFKRLHQKEAGLMKVILRP